MVSTVWMICIGFRFFDGLHVDDECSLLIYLFHILLLCGKDMRKDEANAFLVLLPSAARKARRKRTSHTHTLPRPAPSFGRRMMTRVGSANGLI